MGKALPKDREIYPGRMESTYGNFKTTDMKLKLHPCSGVFDHRNLTPTYFVEVINDYGTKTGCWNVKARHIFFGLPVDKIMQKLK